MEGAETASAVKNSVAQFVCQYIAADDLRQIAVNGDDLHPRAAYEKAFDGGTSASHRNRVDNDFHGIT